MEIIPELTATGISARISPEQPDDRPNRIRCLFGTG